MKKDAGHYYTCDRFDIREFVPEVIYLDRGEKAWQLMDLNLLENWDALAKQLDVPVTLNDWMWGGNRQWQGIRLPDSPDYRSTSQHPYGRAADGKAKGIPANEVRQRIRDRKIILPHPATFEVNVNWIHMDTRQSTDLITFVDTQKVVWRFSKEDEDEN